MITGELLPGARESCARPRADLSQGAKAMAAPKITLAALGGAAAALALQRLRRKWLALPYAWRRSATRTELMRWILFDAAPEWATTERMHALRRAVAAARVSGRVNWTSVLGQLLGETRRTEAALRARWDQLGDEPAPQPARSTSPRSRAVAWAAAHPLLGGDDGLPWKRDPTTPRAGRGNFR